MSLTTEPAPADEIEAAGISLLWPPGAREDVHSRRRTLTAAAIRDLRLDDLLPAFTLDKSHHKEIKAVLTTLCQDPAVINYRQDVLSDLLRYSDLVETLTELLPAIDALGRFHYRTQDNMTTMHEVTYRMGELQSLVDCVEGLGEALDRAGDLQAQGWRKLHRQIDAIRRDADFRNLAETLPGLLAELRSAASVTIGVNLDQFLRPVEATLLAVNDERFTGPSLMGRLFGSRVDRKAGIAPLHTVPKREVDGPYALPIDPELGRSVEPLMVPLFKDLADVIEKITQPIAKELKRFVGINSRMFVGLREDLIFYLGAVRFIRRLEGHGLPTCRPQIAPPEERVCRVVEAYNAALALQQSGGDPDRDLSGMIVPNRINIGPEGRVMILTGPNQGGKTTYMQGAGLIQALFQTGLNVPGTEARISPADNIYTHFPLEEKLETNAGRFGEEAGRLGDIFRRITAASFVLLNESLSSTSAWESLYLAQDLVRIMRRAGVRAIYSTHMHELAEKVDEINAGTPGDSRVVSLVSSPVAAGHEENGVIERTYEIIERAPMGRSYAQEIASRHGVSYRQLEEMLVERGVLEGPAVNAERAEKEVSAGSQGDGL